MTRDEAKTKIVEILTSKINVKTKFYLNDFANMIPELPRREVYKIVNEMVQEGTLEYWSSGSTTLIGLKGAGIQEEG